MAVETGRALCRRGAKAWSGPRTLFPPVLLRPRDRPVPLPLGPAGIRRAAPLGETAEGTPFVAMHARSLGALLTSVAVACHGGPRPLRLGTTYTVQQSGALAVLETYWAGAPLAVVVGPSGQILRSAAQGDLEDRKSTRLNSSHGYISY